MMDINSLVHEEFGKLSAPCSSCFSIYPLRSGRTLVSCDLTEQGKEQPIASILFIIDKEGGKGSIQLESVYPDYRGREIGRKLLEGAERVLLRAGVSEAYVFGNQNPSFWRHMGYNGTNDSKKLTE